MMRLTRHRKLSLFRWYFWFEYFSIIFKISCGMVFVFSNWQITWRCSFKSHIAVNLPFLSISCFEFDVHTVALYVMFIHLWLLISFVGSLSFVEYFWLLFPDSNESSGRRSSALCCVLHIISFAIYHSSRVSFLTCLNLYIIGEGIQFCFYEHIKIELKKQRKTIMLFSRFSPSVSDEVAIIESPYFYEEYIILGIDIFWYSYIRIYLYL